MTDPFTDDSRWTMLGSRFEPVTPDSIPGYREMMRDFFASLPPEVQAFWRTVPMAPGWEIE